LFGAAASAQHLIIKIAAGTAPHLVPERIKFLVGRLVVATIDKVTGMPDPDLSYSLDLLKTKVDLTREDVRGILQGFTQAEIPAANSGISEDGRC
jgi:hypothetical protein